MWVFLGLWTSKACPNTAVCAKTAPLVYPVPSSDSGHSIPSLWVPNPRLRPTILSLLLVPRGFSWCPSLFFPPPSPFSRTTVCVPIPSLPTEEYFCGRPARPHPASLPYPGLPDGLDTSRAPFRDITWASPMRVLKEDKLMKLEVR